MSTNTNATYTFLLSLARALEITRNLFSYAVGICIHVLSASVQSCNVPLVPAELAPTTLFSMCIFSESVSQSTRPSAMASTKKKCSFSTHTVSAFWCVSVCVSPRLLFAPDSRRGDNTYTISERRTSCKCNGIIRRA